MCIPQKLIFRRLDVTVKENILFIQTQNLGQSETALNLKIILDGKVLNFFIYFSEKTGDHHCLENISTDQIYDKEKKVQTAMQ